MSALTSLLLGAYHECAGGCGDVVKRQGAYCLVCSCLADRYDRSEPKREPVSKVDIAVSAALVIAIIFSVLFVLFVSSDSSQHIADWMEAVAIISFWALLVWWLEVKR